jgi:hypothetical protein
MLRSVKSFKTQTMMQSKQMDKPIEIIVKDNVLLSAIPRTASYSSFSIRTTDETEDGMPDSTIPHFVEISPGNYYEVLDSKWEYGCDHSVASHESPRCASEAPLSINSEINENVLNPPHPEKETCGQRLCRRGSLVMTLKKTNTYQEDKARLESIASPIKPTLPFRRGSIVVSFDEEESFYYGSKNVPSADEKRLSSATAPARPFRRASIVMNCSNETESANPVCPCRRGSLVVSVADMEYEVAEPTRRKDPTSMRSQSAGPPRFPSRKASMGMCHEGLASLYSDAPGQVQSKGSRSGRHGSLFWAVSNPKDPAYEEEADQICLTLCGFNIQESSDTLKNLKPKVPHRHSSMDMTSTSVPHNH